MLPSEEAFAAAVSALGIENKDGVVVYDGKGIFSAARVWWWDNWLLQKADMLILYEMTNKLQNGLSGCLEFLDMTEFGF